MSLEKHILRGNEFLGTSFPIICGAMSWISESQLVSSISNTGCFGVIASGAMEPYMLDVEMKKTKQLTNKSFGVNLITLHPKFEEMLEVCFSNNIRYMVFGGSIDKISRELIEKVHSNGARALTFAPTLEIAKRFVKLGIDALILEGNEAGGHIGPTTTFVLAQEVLPFISEVPIFVGGGVGNGYGAAGLLKMGASGVQMGTRFVCAHESIAHQNFKDVFLRSSSRDAVSSVQLSIDFPVIPVRAIKNKASIEFIEFQRQTIEQFRKGELSKKEAQLKVEHFWAGSLRKAIVDGDVERGSLMSGQSVGLLKKAQSVQEIIDELIAEIREKF